MAKTRTQTFSVTLPAGTPAGAYTKPDVLDSHYTRAVGVTAYVNKDGGQTAFRLGISDDTAVYASLANVKHYQAGIDCPKPLRLTPLSIRANGAQLTINVQLFEALTSDLDVDMVFTLESADGGN